MKREHVESAITVVIWLILLSALTGIGVSIAIVIHTDLQTP